MEERVYKTTEAQRRGNAKYDAKTYKMVTLKIRKEYASKIDEYINANNYNSRNNFIISCVKYCMDNNIDIDAQKKENEKESI